jgi:hypothetical protein
MGAQAGGLVIYRGPSMIDGTPIRAIITGRSGNRKTGNMCQLTILVDNGKTPVQAAKDGDDAAICGSCAYRGTLNPETGEWGHRGCYVVLAQGPSSIHRKDERAGYGLLTTALQIEEFLAGRKVRLGMYANPSALPYDVVEPLARAAEGWTGYDSEHKTCDPRFAGMLMASVQSTQAADEAEARGWRYFRSAPADSFEVRPNEVLCPAVSTGGRVQCIDCLLCDGTRFGARAEVKNVVLPIHGTGRKHADAVASN